MKPAQKIKSLKSDVEQFYRLLAEFVRMYQYRDRSCICYHDISITQCYAIEALVRLGALTLNELSSELHLDKSTASRVVDAIERKGYVTRKKDIQDARAIQLDVTRKGKELHDLIEYELVFEQQKLLDKFSQSERKTALKLLEALVGATKARFAEMKERVRPCKLAG